MAVNTFIANGGKDLALRYVFIKLTWYSVNVMTVAGGAANCKLVN